MAPRLVIVGSGRSGSGYIAALLNAVGVPTGHERWFSAFGISEPGYLADSSWLALTLGLASFDGTIVHQVRHPLDVVSSLVKEPLPEPYYSHQARLIRDRLLCAPVDPVEFGMAAWVTFNRQAGEFTDWWWQVESVDAPLLQRVAAAAGVHVTGEQASSALCEVSTRHNSHGDGPRLGWDDLPLGLLHDALLSDAARWGYET